MFCSRFENVNKIKLYLFIYDFKLGQKPLVLNKILRFAKQPHILEFLEYFLVFEILKYVEIS